MLYARKDFDACEKALRESLAILRRTNGLAHPDTLTVLDSLVSVVGGGKRLGEAEKLLLEAFEAVRDEPTIDTNRKQALAARLAQLYQALGKPDKAAEWSRRADRLRALETTTNAATTQPSTTNQTDSPPITSTPPA